MYSANIVKISALDEVIRIVKKELDKIVPQKIPPPGQKLIDSWMTP